MLLRLNALETRMTKPPVAPRIPHTFSHHGITIQDPYHWLKDESYPNVENPEILAYLEAENAYFKAQMDPYQALVEQLFKEIKDRQPVEDASVPYRKGDYWYRWRFEADAQYRQWLRTPHQSEPAATPIDSASWEVILDEPQLATEHEYFTLGGMAVSPNGRYLAWSADTSGAERVVRTRPRLRQRLRPARQASHQRRRASCRRQVLPQSAGSYDAAGERGVNHCGHGLAE